MCYNNPLVNLKVVIADEQGVAKESVGLDSLGENEREINSNKLNHKTLYNFK